MATIRTSRKVTIRASRKIGLHHFAFWRGHLEGLDIAMLGDRYLETGADRVRAKATLRWFRDELIAAARRQSKPAIARLLRVPLEKIAPSSPDSSNPVASMTLEDFQAERDPSGFYSESELIALFEKEAQQGDPVAARKASRNDRLRRRLREATLWLENFLCVEPLPDDPLSAWLDEIVARRLNAAGINLISDLQALIRKRGKHWHRKVPKLGPIGAKRLQKWLATANLLKSDSPAVSGPSTQGQIVRSAGIYPLERFTAPEALTGVTGTNRAYGTAMAARDDREAIEAWLASQGPKVHTVRNYRKEAERFLLWCIFEREKAMSSATLEDCTAYRNFLSDLGCQNSLWFWNVPQSKWIGPRNQPRWSEDWKPFSGALELSSQRQSVVILTIMFEFLRRQRYLETNPWDGVSPILSTTPTIRKDHALTVDQWAAVMSTLENTEVKDEAYFRLRFVLLLGYMGGFRLDEMANSRVAKHDVRPGDFNPGLKVAEDGDGWDLEVIGKGMRARTVPVANDVLNALCDYMDARGLGAEPDNWPPETPLIVTLPHGLQYVTAERHPVSWTALYRMLKLHFKKASINMPTARDASHLLRASTHWLRHTHATHALNAGASIRDVQEILGHSSPATTSIYLHSGRKRKKAAVERLSTTKNEG